ncbi:hypothetical protein DM860_012511 [Cuscuta australis]|uniref:Myb-like domain-containing protein n=1 Tax=Cuscuta australis TaxID=267555 RepID=A0A328DDQ5_9ASTE|nr:hypothetical protein DM860_012511 [Cuscuta australis]
MAASANAAPGSGNENSSNSQEAAGNANGASVNGLSVPENSVLGPTQAALRHNPGISVEWTPEEQSLLEELLATYVKESNVVRYAKIAMQLNDKTVRDVALRCRWMTKKENSKRRKEDHNSSRKSKEKKEKVTESVPKPTQVANQTSVPVYAHSAAPLDNDDGISYKDIGGPTGQLLEHISHSLDQISTNFASFKIHENISLFCQTRNNILSILNDLKDMPETMKQMPPLPVKLNEELANSILPQPLLPNTS